MCGAGTSHVLAPWCVHAVKTPPPSSCVTSVPFKEHSIRCCSGNAAGAAPQPTRGSRQGRQRRRRPGYCICLHNPAACDQAQKQEKSVWISHHLSWAADEKTAPPKTGSTIDRRFQDGTSLCCMIFGVGCRSVHALLVMAAVRGARRAKQCMEQCMGAMFERVRWLSCPGRPREQPGSEALHPFHLRCWQCPAPQTFARSKLHARTRSVWSDAIRGQARQQLLASGASSGERGHDRGAASLCASGSVFYHLARSCHIMRSCSSGEHGQRSVYNAEYGRAGLLFSKRETSPQSLSTIVCVHIFCLESCYAHVRAAARRFCTQSPPLSLATLLSPWRPMETAGGPHPLAPRDRSRAPRLLPPPPLHVLAPTT